jgi:translation elongation factor EF-Tu-like GTPase
VSEFNRWPEDMQRHSPDFRARVRFFSDEEGGRNSPARQGYRPDLCYKDGAFELFMIWPRFLDEALREKEDEAEIPSSSLADFWIVSPELKEEVHRPRIQPGTEFWMCEGRKRVAEVTVIELLEGLR